MLVDRRDRRPILLANARIVDPSRDLDFPGDLLIADGVIREAKRGIDAAGVPEGTEVVDCRGKLVAPGLVDMRAFIGEPGAEYRETLASASQAAAAGGVTTIVCQPDTEPVIDDPAIVDFVLRRARDTAIVHVQPMAALTKGLEGEEMTEIGLLKAAGAVAFTDGAQSVTNAQVMRRALTYARDFDALIVHHTEDPGPDRRRRDERGRVRRAPRPDRRAEGRRDHHARARHAPRRADRGRYHAASITCAESLDVLRRAKEAGLAVTAAASINHLTLNEIDIGAYRTFFKLSPPLRAEDDRARWSRRSTSGLIDVVMSDHNPQDVEIKRLPFAEAAAGAIGLETMLAAALRLVHRRRAQADDAAQGAVDPARRTARPARRHAAARRAGRRDRDRSGRALGARSRRAEIEVQEHAVRRGAAAGPRGAHHRRRPHGLRIRVSISPAGEDGRGSSAKSPSR